MKSSLALLIVLFNNLCADNQIVSAFTLLDRISLTNSRFSSRFVSQKQDKNAQCRKGTQHMRNALFLGRGNNILEASKSCDNKSNLKRRGTHPSPFLKAMKSKQLNKSFLPRTDTNQHFKVGDEMEGTSNTETDSTLWRRALNILVPNFSTTSSAMDEKDGRKKNPEIVEISSAKNSSILSNFLGVESLLAAFGDLNFEKESAMSSDLNSYLDAILLESEGISQVSNDTNILSSLNWANTSSLPSTPTLPIESIIEQTTSLLNVFFLKATASFMLQSAIENNNNVIQDVIQNINVSSRTMAMAVDKLMEETESLARENALDVGVAVEEARGYAQDMIDLVNTVLVDGYLSETISLEKETKGAADPSYKVDITKKNNTTNPRKAHALFENYDARPIPPNRFISSKAVDMAHLAASLYEPDTVFRAHDLQQTIVARGSTSDVIWLVTDGIVSNINDMSWNESNENGMPTLVRTITIKGFDATDASVDRERLLRNIWTATPETLSDDGNIAVHSGLLSVARALYEELSQYLYGLAPSHKIVLNGHSIGGSLSNLLLMLLTKDKGADWVKDKVLRVYTYGAPPIAYSTSNSSKSGKCDVLEAFDLPPTIVNGFCQPWDPCLRLFSGIDPIYPILDDIGIDGKTLWASGPNRALRPITRAIIESWENWPSLRDKYRETASQNYVSIGMQYLLLPETVRYLMDRLVSVNLAVPETEVVVELPPGQLFNALDHAFPIDTFGISTVPTALRSFIHHFHPAYAATDRKSVV